MFTLFYNRIHIRRTDKTSEALFYSVDQYMVHVEEYFQFRDLLHHFSHNETKGDRRIVYLVSDDTNIFDEISEKYPNYLFKSNRKSSKMGSVNSRYSPEAIKNLILDIHILSMCEFFVGTFSSQIGRSVHELMQTRRDTPMPTGGTNL